MHSFSMSRHGIPGHIATQVSQFGRPARPAVVQLPRRLSRAAAAATEGVSQMRTLRTAGLCRDSQALRHRPRHREIALFGHVFRRFARGFNVVRPSLQYPVHAVRYGDECIGDGYRARINQSLTSSKRRRNSLDCPAPILLIPYPRIPARDAKCPECHRQRDLRDEPCSAVNPNIRARSGTVHPALRECRPPRQIILEALSAGSGLRPVVVLALRRASAGSCFPLRNFCPHGCGRCRASFSASAASSGGRFAPSR